MPASAWAVPEYSKGEVNAAGKMLATGGGEASELEHALRVINNWRSSHSFPLNTIQVTLRRIAKSVDPGALAAQRIKRLSSIAHKLERYPSMQLARMQDIGGCRAIVATVAKVESLHQAYRDRTLRHRHHLVREDDYIAEPKPSGYRGVHLVFRYESDRKQTYNGLHIEMQLRSRLQHAWATAVETVGTFLEQALKSSRGSDRWLRFFSLMGSALAARERRPPVPGTPEGDELREELRGVVAELSVVEKLAGYGRVVTIYEKSGGAQDAFYYLLELRPSQGAVTIAEYAKGELERATAEYLEIERAIQDEAGSEAVLVSVESIEALRRAYPNYFLDTRVFLDAVREAVE